MQLGTRLVRAAGLCVATWLLATGRADDAGNAKTLEAFFRARGYEPVRLELTAGNKLVVQGTLGERKIRCLIDTGCSITSIDAAHVGRATELTNRSSFTLDAFGQRVGRQKNLVALETLKLGRCQFTGQPASVRERTWTNRRSEDAPIGSRISRNFSNADRDDLILGWDFIARNFAVIDCNRATIYFRGSEPPSALQVTIKGSLRLSGFDEIPLQKTNSNAGIVIGRMKGQEIRFFVDTGAGTTGFDRAEAKRLGLNSQNLHAEVVGVSGGRSELGWAPTEDIHLADHRVGNFNTGIEDFSAINLLRKLGGQPPLTGIIGMDLLSRDEALIDCQGGRIFLRSHGK